MDVTKAPKVSLVEPKVRMTSAVAGEMIVEARGLSGVSAVMIWSTVATYERNVTKDTIPTAVTFFFVVQFMGFAGSSGPSHVTMLGSASALSAVAGLEASKGPSGCFSTSCSGSDSALVEDRADAAWPVGLRVDMRTVSTAGQAEVE